MMVSRGAIGIILGLMACNVGAENGVPVAEHPLNKWVIMSPKEGKPSPHFGWEGSAAWDPFSRLWIHHAGHDGNPQGFVTFTCDLTTGDWRQRFPQTSPPGVCCVDGANVFDIANRYFVRFPGGSLGHGYQWSRGVKLKESPVWLYDVSANRWMNMRPAPYGDFKNSRDKIGGLNPSGAYDTVHELAISFGGIGSAGGKNNVHLYDAWSNTLYQPKPAKNQPWPSERDGCGLAYDSANDKLVLFGGQYTNDEKTWVYDLRMNQWEALDLDPHPPAKKGKTYSTIPKMTYDAVNQVILCIVWLDEERGHETWVLNLKDRQWIKMNPQAEPAPSKSRTRNLDFSAADNLAIMETWSVKSEPQIWTYRYAAGPAEKAAANRVEGLMVETTEKSAKLAWKPVAGARGYVVQRGEGLPWEVGAIKVGDSSGPAFEDASVARGKVYTYIVKAIVGDTGQEGSVGPASFRARTDPRIPAMPVVSVARDRVELTWPKHPAGDVVGYNVYRAGVVPRLVTKGTPGAWKDNDPDYGRPYVVGVESIGPFAKLNDKPIAQAAFTDPIKLTENPAADYGLAVYAYIVRAVNRLGVESGPSPYALTIPGEPVNLLCREAGGSAELKWDASAEQGISGYHVYKLEGGVWGIKRITDRPIQTTTFKHNAGKETTRYWITAVDALGQEGQPSSPAWYGKAYKGFFEGDWHQ